MSNSNDFEIREGVLYKYIGPGGDVVIPDGVTGIGCDAFKECTNLQSVVIPEGVTHIGHNAFNKCTNLQSVVIPEGVTGIGCDVFNKCTNLQSVVIPEGVTYIGCDVFYECTSLQSIIIPEGVTHIGYNAFSECTSLTEIMIPNGVTHIEFGAFFGCTNLKKVHIPSTINRLGRAFIGLKNLQEVIIECEEDDKKYAKFIGTYLFDLDDMVKYYLRDILKMNAVMEKAIVNRIKTKPNRKKYFPNFIYNDQTEYVAKYLSIIPKMEVDEIDEYITLSTGHPQISAMFIDYKNKLYTPDDISKIEEIQIQKDLGMIERTFADWRKIYKLTPICGIYTLKGYKADSPVAIVPAQINKEKLHIGSYAFRGCDCLQSVTIEKGISSIGECTFLGCINLEVLKLPETISFIGMRAFKDCRKLKELHFSKNIREIRGERVFEGCSNLTVYCPADGEMEKYCKKYKIPYVIE